MKTDVHQKIISLIYLDSSFISYTTSKSRDSFISSYCNCHNLDTIPFPTIHPLSTTHTSAAEPGTELLLHIKSLQLQLKMDYKPSAKQSKASSSCPLRAMTKNDENNRDILLKKLSNEIILGKPMSLQQWNLMLKEAQVLSNSKTLSKRNAINKTKTTVRWEKNTTIYKNHLNNHNNKSRK